MSKKSNTKQSMQFLETKRVSNGKVALFGFGRNTKNSSKAVRTAEVPENLYKKITRQLEKEEEKEIARLADESFFQRKLSF